MKSQDLPVEHLSAVYDYHEGGIVDLQKPVDQTTYRLNPNAHYGFSVWEGMRCNKGNIFRLADHAERLIKSAKITNTPFPEGWQDPEKEIEQGIIIASKQSIINTTGTGFYIRPRIYFAHGYMGPYQRGRNVTNYEVLTWPWEHLHSTDVISSGTTAIVDEHSKTHQHREWLKAKTPSNYVFQLMELEKAKDKGYGDIIFLNKNGFVAETYGANIFFVKDSKVLTPSSDMPEIINGITRNSVIQLLKHGGLEVIEDLIPENLMYECDEAFLTGTAVRIVPITTIADKNEKKHLIGDGTPGEITKKIYQSYLDAISDKTPAFKHWLTDVNVTRVNLTREELEELEKIKSDQHPQGSLDECIQQIL
ncbi:MAG TPA: aminotransferase class IV [Candidatus Nanoarchaeia archaeon]|nr:aminotransferase class IV [Candidatus Nanoarchaeia archaeon]